MCVFECYTAFLLTLRCDTDWCVSQNAELVVGNVAGNLHIFKGSKSQKAWRTCGGLGTVSGEWVSHMTICLCPL